MYKDEIGRLKKTVKELQTRALVAEKKVKENPWLAVGIVGLFALVIGIFLGTSRKPAEDEEN